jgi:hypothetical protein
MAILILNWAWGFTVSEIQARWQFPRRGATAMPWADELTLAAKKEIQ